MEWDIEAAEKLKLTIFGQPDRVISRGHGHGVSKKIKGFFGTMLGFPEELIEACANLYNEVVVALAALRDSTNSPNYYLGFLQIL